MLSILITLLTGALAGYLAGKIMNTKNDVEVIINGKQYTLSGYESSEYLQKIATHINEKIGDFSKLSQK